MLSLGVLKIYRICLNMSSLEYFHNLKHEYKPMDFYETKKWVFSFKEVIFAGRCFRGRNFSRRKFHKSDLNSQGNLPRKKIKLGISEIICHKIDFSLNSQNFTPTALKFYWIAEISFTGSVFFNKYAKKSLVELIFFTRFTKVLSVKITIFGTVLRKSIFWKNIFP